MGIDAGSRSIGGRFAVFLALATLIAPGRSFGHNGAVAVAYPARGIVVDGNLSDWPAGLKAQPIARVEDGDTLKGEADLAATFRIAYDAQEHAIYVAVEVKDDSVIADGPGKPTWNSQDSCELFLDATHAATGPRLIQYARYGKENMVVGPPEVTDKTMKVTVVRADSRIVYEWRIEVAVDLSPERTIGFDVSVADKDEDGSFSWLSWGTGTQKLDQPDRCGEVLLVGPDTKFGEISGRISWEEASASALPSHVLARSTRFPHLAVEGIVDPSGAYKASDVPIGSFVIRPVDSADVRVKTDASVAIEVEEGKVAEVPPLHVTPVPWPGLIGEEGVLRGSEPFNAEELDRVMSAYLDYYSVPGISVAVIKDSKIVYHRGFGVKNAASAEPVADDTVFEAASMTKPVFAYIVMRLVDRGVLDLDTPLHTYLPYEDIAHDDRYKLITARMVLTHRTGFPNWRTGKLDIKFTPGTEVSYSGEGFVYLGKVVEKLTGRTLVDLCREDVFTPLGIEHASLIWTDDVARMTATGHGGRSPLSKGKPDQPNMAASLHVSAGEYAKFLIAVVQGKGLEEATSKEMLRPQVKVPDRVNSSWGLGVAIEETPQGVHYGHGGRNTGFTSKSVMDREKGIGYVFLVNNDDAQKFDNILNAYLLAGKGALKAIGAAVHKVAKVDPKLYDAYIGRYEMGKHEILTITRDGDRLMAQATDEGKTEVFPESETSFFLKPTADDLVTFVKDERGEVTHIILRHDGAEKTAKRLDDGAK
ncbi:serine hydrolase [Isosphaeraceae bacterium EP7]